MYKESDELQETGTVSIDAVLSEEEALFESPWSQCFILSALLSLLLG